MADILGSQNQSPPEKSGEEAESEEKSGQESESDESGQDSGSDRTVTEDEYEGDETEGSQNNKEENGGTSQHKKKATRSSSRIKTPTEKGQLYECERKLAELKHVFRRLERQRTVVQEAFFDGDDVRKVHADWVVYHRDFVTAKEECLRLMMAHEQEQELERWLDMTEEFINSSHYEFEEFRRGRKETQMAAMNDNIRPDDSVSQVSTRLSRKSRFSRSSSRSSHVSSARIKEVQNLAELQEMEKHIEDDVVKMRSHKGEV